MQCSTAAFFFQRHALDSLSLTHTHLLLEVFELFGDDRSASTLHLLREERKMEEISDINLR